MMIVSIQISGGPRFEFADEPLEMKFGELSIETDRSKRHPKDPPPIDDWADAPMLSGN